ncbi:MAG: Fe(3+) ABC transporter substrate-binding protein [Bacteroidales bacterium]|nr:Fe(3+) ABC transporter substrate-binding protein [Bacteroidales bacterium]
MRYYIVFISLFMLLLQSCSIDSEEAINVYSGRHYSSDEVLFKRFSDQTGIKVNLIKADSDQLINRLTVEGENSPADLFITADVSRLSQAANLGLLQAIPNEVVEDQVPSNLRDPDGMWVGLTKRARVIVYNKERVNKDELANYEDLTDFRWKSRILVRSSQSHYNQSLIASIISALGVDKSRDWVSGLVTNFSQEPKGNDRDQVKAIAAGIGDVALVNTYYLGLLLNSANSEEREVAEQVGIIFPNQGNRGTHVNVSGVGLTASSSNRENAVKLIKFLLRTDSQEYLSSENFEYPVNPDAKWPELLTNWGTFKEDSINLNSLNKFLPEAMMIANQAGWK